MHKKPITDFLHHYQLKPNIKAKLNITHDILITNHTTDKFIEYHPKNAVYFKQIKSTLQKIRKKEEVNILDNTKIYFHSYRILFWIDLYINALDFYNSETYQKFSFAKYESKNKKIKDAFFQLQKKSLDPYLFDNSSRLQMKILQLFIENRELIDLILNTQTLFPQSMINYNALEDDVNVINYIQKLFHHFASSYISSEDVILKSLAIVLYSYMIFQMKMKSSFAKGIVQDIMQKLFSYEFESISSTNIYITGRLDHFPIFKVSSRKEIYSQKLKNDFTIFSKYTQRGFADNELFDLNPDHYFNSNLLKAYFEQYPTEFMEKID